MNITGSLCPNRFILNCKYIASENIMVRVCIQIKDDYKQPRFFIHYKDCHVARNHMDNPGRRKIIVRLGDDPNKLAINRNCNGGWIEFPTEQEALIYHKKKYPNYKLKKYLPCRGCLITERKSK